MEHQSKNLLKLAERLFSSTDERNAFIQCFLRPKSAISALLWITEQERSVFEEVESYAWQPQFVSLVQKAVKPGSHELHTRGAYYCLDSASVFVSTPLLEVPPEPKLVFDMCASPGGKAIFAWRALKPEMLVANEVIKKRTAALISNLKRCKIAPLSVCSIDSSVLSEQYALAADVVIVDAPCSGQSLVVKGEKAQSPFHPVNINKCAMRQRRILANSAKIVAPGGFLLYTTCTFSIEENEAVIEWFLKSHEDFKAQGVAKLQLYQSGYSDVPCYRLFPMQGEGAGGFSALLKRDDAGVRGDVNLKKIRLLMK